MGGTPLETNRHAPTPQNSEIAEVSNAVIMKLH